MLQLIVATFFFGVVCYPYLHFGSFRDVRRWSMVAPCFAGMLLTSALAMHQVSLTLIIVVRAFSPLLTAAVEAFFPNPPAFTVWTFLSILGVIVGSGLYAS